MKFIALAVAGCLATALSHAQIKKGSLLFGGTLGYTSISQDINTTDPGTSYDSQRKELLLSPSFAVALANNLFIGADLTWNNINEKYSQINIQAKREVKYITKGGGVFARKYWNIVDRFYIFGQGRVGIETFKNDIAFAPPALPYGYDKGYTIAASIYPGLSFALSKKVHLESTFLNLITLQYTKSTEYSKQTDTKQYKESYFDVSSSFDNATNFTIGIKVLLSK